MTKHNIPTYRRRLQELASRLQGEVASIQDEALRPTGTVAGGVSDEQADPGAQAAEATLAMTLLGTEVHELAEINAALDRIDRGTFGRCEACQHPISQARLDVLPQARHCIKCARQLEVADGVNGRES